MAAAGPPKSTIDDPASGAKDAQGLASKPDPVAFVDMVQRQRGHYVVDGGILGGEPVGVPLDESE